MTTRYLPMLAASAPAPFSSDDWLFESKWDGVRAIASVGTTLSLRSRNDVELSDRFPELAELLALAPGTVLDGEIGVMSGGKPDIQSLLPRLQAGGPGTGSCGSPGSSASGTTCAPYAIGATGAGKNAGRDTGPATNPEEIS